MMQETRVSTARRGSPWNTSTAIRNRIPSHQNWPSCNAVHSNAAQELRQQL